MIIAFIPARGGSKSIPLKNIKPLCGKPLIHWAIHSLDACKKIDRIVIATDSDAIVDSVKTISSKKLSIYARSHENAQDHSSTESVMIEYLESSGLSDDDVFILVQATSPFTTAEDYQSALMQYETKKHDSLLSVVRSKRFYWLPDGVPVNYDYMNRPRRQDFPGTFMENGAFYINRVKNIRKHGNRLSGRIGFHVMPEYTGLELDEPDDWTVAENLMVKYGIVKKNPGTEIKILIMDVDGVLTDAGMYYSENGVESKKFNTHDGMGIKLLREKGIKTAIITTENTRIVEARAKKLNIDYLYQGIFNKLETAKQICEKENVGILNTAFIGDDINDISLLSACGLAACPADAMDVIKSIPGIIQLSQKGGQGVVREFCDLIIREKLQ